MKSFTIVALLAALAFATSDHEFRIWNNCPFTIWPALQGKGNPEKGGFQLDMNKTHGFRVRDDFSGEVWARTNCNSTGLCETGDCGNKIQCNGTAGVSPLTLAEFILSKHDGGMDHYSVNLENGFNLPISVSPINGTYKRKLGGKTYCATAGCNHGQDVNVHCPKELTVHNKTGKVIACKSACLAFNTDQYCCRKTYDQASKCKPSKYSKVFKQYCPNAFSFRYDLHKTIFACRGQPKVGYVIKFCP